MRSFRTEISENRRLNSELSPESHSAILYGLSAQKLPTQLATEFNITHSIIYQTRALAAGVPSTIKQILKGYHIKKWKSKKRISLIRDTV